MKDKQRGQRLAKAIKLLEQAQTLIDEGLPATDYSSELTFSLHCVSVELETQVGYYLRGEMDPVR